MSITAVTTFELQVKLHLTPLPKHVLACDGIQGGLGGTDSMPMTQMTRR